MDHLSRRRCQVNFYQVALGFSVTYFPCRSRESMRTGWRCWGSSITAVRIHWRVSLTILRQIYIQSRAILHTLRQKYPYTTFVITVLTRTCAHLWTPHLWSQWTCVFLSKRMKACRTSFVIWSWPKYLLRIWDFHKYCVLIVPRIKRVNVGT